MITFKEFGERVESFLKPLIKKSSLSIDDRMVIFSGMINDLGFMVSNSEVMINFLVQNEELKGYGMYFHETKARGDYTFKGPQELGSKLEDLFNYIIDFSEGLRDELPADFKIS